MKHPLAMDDSCSESDLSDEEDSGKVIFASPNKAEAMGSREGRPCWTTRTYSRAKTKGEKTKRGKSLGVALQEDEWLESILDVGKEKKEKLQDVKREAALKKGKGTPKRPKKLPLAPVSKSPTEEDCSYGWQQSCWRCSRRSGQLRLCSACQVCIDRRILSKTMPLINLC